MKEYSSKDHNIRHEHIDPDALDVVLRLQDAGHEAYLVGGCVRDLLLGREPKDFDVSTSARPEQVKRLFRNCMLIGRRFRLAHVRFGRNIIEVATFRAGDPDEAELITRDNEWGTAEEDVMRRDFTVNGLYYDPSAHKIIDYVGGFEDTQENLLRVVGDPVTRFKQDPVRMIRCLKFRARFGFNMDPSILPAIEACRHEILKSSQARVMEEMLRMLESGASEPFIRLLDHHDFLEFLFPFLVKGLGKELRNEIYAYLCVVDALIQARNDRKQPNRCVLAAALVYPMVYHQVAKLHEGRERPPHLGEIHAVILGYMREVLEGDFLQWSRRLRVELTYILDAQFRMTPLSPKKIQKKRMVQQPDFRFALGFLRLRSLVDTELNNTYLAWRELYMAEKPERPKRELKPRRRRRRR